MNQRLTERLAAFPETVGKATNMEGVQNAFIDISRHVLNSNFEEAKAGQDPGPYISRDYSLGDRNTRGLSWKLNLMRMVCEGTFCHMHRVGVHGGQVQIRGTEENVNTAIQIFEALVPAFEAQGKTAFTEFSDGPKEEGAPTPHRAGWINQYLISAPAEISTALSAVRSEDAGKNGKLAAMIAERENGLKEYQASLAPVKPAPEPKTPKAKKAPKTATPVTATPDGEVPQEATADTATATPDASTGENADAGNTDADAGS